MKAEDSHNQFSGARPTNLLAKLSYHFLTQMKETEELSEYGFSPEEINAIERLSLKQLRHLARFGGDYLDLRIDRTCFCKALARVLDQDSSESLQDQMLRRQAPVEMLKAWFGMDHRDVSERRRQLGIRGTGRPRAPTEAEITVLHQRWRETAKLAEPERYLALADATGLSLAVIWSVSHEFSANTTGGGRP